MSVKEEWMSDVDDEVYSERTIKIEPISTESEDQYSLIVSVIKESLSDCEDDTDTVSTRVLKINKTDVPVKDEIEIGPTVIQPQYIGSSLHTTDASKAELIQCGGADVALDTTTPGAASYRGLSRRSRLHGNIYHQIKKEDKGILKGRNLEKLFSCDICQYKCKIRGNLVRHKLIHNDDKPFSCNFCQYKCKLKSSMVIHIRTHTGEKPFACKFCEYKCKVKSSLVTHERVHKGEKPLSCNICSYKSAFTSSIQQHMRIHSKENPYSCNVCEYKCKVKSNMKKHIYTHTREKPFSCNICQYKCASSSSLKRHMHIHTRETPL